jgi:DNA-binding CsgD family transcriptional regulator
MIVRREIGRRLKKDIRLWEQLEVTFHEEVQTAIDTASYQRHIERFLTEKMVHDALEEANCSDLEQEVMEHHLEGKQLSDIQEEMGRTYKSVEMARNRAMKKLEAVLRAHNWR